MWSQKSEKSLKYSLKVIEKEGQDKCQNIELERKIIDRNYRFQLFKMFEETSKVNFALKRTACKNENKPFPWDDFKTVKCDLVNFKEDCRNKRFMTKRTGRCKSMPSLQLYISENAIHLPLINADNKLFKTVKEKEIPKLIKKNSLEYLGKSGRAYHSSSFTERSLKTTPCLEDLKRHTETITEPLNRGINDYKTEKNYKESSEAILGDTQCFSFKYKEDSESKRNEESSKASEDYKKSNNNIGWVDNTNYVNRKSNRCTFLTKDKRQLVLPSIIKL